MQTVLVIGLVSIIAFSILHLIPGDPVLAILGEEATREQVDTLRHELGLDRPPLLQYGSWVAGVLHGDFGQSLILRESVAELIAKRLPVTFHLGLTALILSILFGIPAGIVSATHRGGFVDSVITILANLGMAVPTFWLGILGIYVFALKLGWLPVQGYTSPFENLWASTRQLVMPAMSLAVIPVAVLARQTRSSMLEVLEQEYVRTARSKGLNEWTVVTVHAFRNAIIPVITLLGLQIRSLVSGSVLVETVFNIPGMGRLLVDSVFNRDFVTVEAIILIVAVVVALSNLAVDISYGYLDPRIRINQ
jgi:peptide/nickel transport system permease protein